MSFFINNFFLRLLSLSFPTSFAPAVSSRLWKVANNCLWQCLLSPLFSLVPFSLSPHSYLYLSHLAVIAPDVPTRLRIEILAPLSLSSFKIHANPLHIGGNVFPFRIYLNVTGVENMLEILTALDKIWVLMGRNYTKNIYFIYLSIYLDSSTAYRIEVNVRHYELKTSFCWY